MSFSEQFETKEMRSFIEKVDVAMFNMRNLPKPSKNGTGSGTAVAQADFHARHYIKMMEAGKATKRDMLRVQFSEACAHKDPKGIMEGLVSLAALCAEWYIELEQADG